MYLINGFFGIGASLDAINYGDQGANTLVHIAEACARGEADIAGQRSGPLHLPHLTQRGLMHAAVASSGLAFVDLAQLPQPNGLYGYAVEQSLGKDTPSGHWELAGVPVDFQWGYFPNQPKCFPQKLIDDLIKKANLVGVLGEKHASGTEIIVELGAEHLLTNKPIVYTSADSVFQIAAHEEYFGLQRLYEVCEIARQLVDEYQIGRVIARPFIGQPGSFKRTAHRRDYATLPPAKTLLDYLQEAGHEVIGIGKIADIFAHQGVTQVIKADDNMALFDATLSALAGASAGSLIFTNFVDFDSSYGHRRNVARYARALEQFDARLPELDALLQKDDIVVIAADHGCDPTFPGSDHTREHIPVLVYGPNIPGRFIGRRDSFADVGQTLAEYFKLAPLDHGIAFEYE